MVMRQTAATLLALVFLASPARPGDLRFAEHLYGERDFYRAITEYKRHLFLHPNAPEAPWVLFRIGQSYLEGGRAEAALAVFGRLLEESHDPRLGDWTTLSTARAFYLDDRLEQARAVLDEWLPTVRSAELRGSGLYLAGCIRLKLGQLEQSREAFSAIWAGHPLAERAGWLTARTAELPDLPSKSPVLAGVLSIIPGLGHLYLEEYAVAITALVWNGLFGFATWDAFRRGEIGIGSLLASLSLLWYSGTIYGAVSGAHRYNRDARLNFLDELDRGAGLDIEAPGTNAVGAILLQGTF
jgi:tetratricopeptide (TPR) repeat protein